MTKREEVDILREAEKKLGPNSYIGPWIGHVADYVEHCLTIDIFPNLVPADTAAQVLAKKKECEDHCKKLRDSCDEYIRREKDKLNIIAEQARKDAENVNKAVKDRVRKVLQKAIDDL